MKVKSTSAKLGDWIFVIICLLISVICVVPMLNLLAKSLSSTEYLVKNAVSIWPKGFNLDAYKTVLSDPKYIRAFFWTVFLTVVCTFVSLAMTVLCAYPLIFEKLKGRRVINIIITITMFFNAGAGRNETSRYPVRPLCHRQGAAPLSGALYLYDQLSSG